MNANWTARKLIACLVLAGSSLLAHADTLYLRDGRTVRGTFLSGTSRTIRFVPEGGRAQNYAIGSVDRVAFGDAGTARTSSRSTAPGAADYSRTNSSPARGRLANDAIPAGTVVTVRMIDPIDSDNTDAGQTFRASLDEPLVVDGRTLAPQGADATVKVERVDQSGTFSGREEVAVVLSEIRANGRVYTPQTNHAELAAKSRKDETVKIVGGTAVVGAIIGAIAGGGKGAAIGAATGAGAGAAVQAIRGQRVQIPSETRLEFTVADGRDNNNTAR